MARVLAIVLSLAVIVYAANYLIFGAQISTVQEIPEGSQEPLPPAVVEYEPYPTAFIPLAAAVILIAGLWANKEMIAWMGWAILTVFSVLFLFSSGGGLLPLDGILLILLLAITFLRQRKMQQQVV